MRYSDSGNGITADSIAFYRDHQDRLGPIETAELRFPGFEDPPDPYLMVLRDANGNEIQLSGCTTGYPGEGPRGAMLVLLEAGWSADEARQVFSAATLQLSRDVGSTAIRQPRSILAEPRERESVVANRAARRQPGIERD
jgi:hypothetical protein